MRFKRFLLVTVALLGALALGVPGWIGRDAEARYREMVATLDARPLPLDFRVVAFDRGWFASRARVRIGAGGDASRAFLEALGADADDPTLVLDDRIAHGPLPFAAGNWWRPALAAVSGTLGPASGNDPVARIDYRIGPLGGLELALGADRGDTGGAAWRDLRLEASLARDGRTASLLFRADRVAVITGDGRVEARQASAGLDVDPAGATVSSWRAGAESLRLTTPDAGRTLGSLEALSLAGGVARDGERVGGKIEGRLARAASPRESYGPGEVRLALRDLDAAALARLANGASALAGRGMAGRQFSLALAGALLAELPKLLAHDPVLVLERLSLVSPDGELTGGGRLGLASVEPVVLNNPFLLQRAVTGHFQLDVPPVAARHAALLYLRRAGLVDEWGTPEAWLRAQVDRGRLRRTAEGYHFELRLSEGRISLNGRPGGAGTAPAGQLGIPGSTN